MPRKKIDLSNVSLADLEATIARKKAVGPLEKKRAAIQKEMAKIDAELKRLTVGKSFRKKKAAIKAGASRLTVEQAAVQVIQTRGQPMAFQDILGSIVEFKLVTTKSKNFANVLRRTLTVSKAVKRTGRGVYDVA